MKNMYTKDPLKKYRIEMVDYTQLNKFFNQFLELFAENTRGHEKKRAITDDYIKSKAEEILKYLETGRALLFSAFDDDKIIGFLWAYPRIFFDEQRIYINSMIIKSDYRGKGLGRLLISKLEEYAKQMNIFIIDVSTASFKTDAIKFYEDLGFESERVQLRKELK